MLTDDIKTGRQMVIQDESKESLLIALAVSGVKMV
jgi:hypothetical protein